MIGILALQGAFREHQKILEVLRQRTLLIKKPPQLEVVDGLVFCGGESTTISLLIKKYGFLKPLKDYAKKRPVLASCAGLIVLAKEVINGQSTIASLDVTVKRNAFGRQYDSFEEEISIPLLGNKSFPAVFIRAPWIERAGDGVDVLARSGGKIVAVKQRNILATAFHPELTRDTRFHQYFISMVSSGDRPYLREKGTVPSDTANNQQTTTNN